MKLICGYGVCFSRLFAANSIHVPKLMFYKMLLFLITFVTHCAFRLYWTVPNPIMNEILGDYLSGARVLEDESTILTYHQRLMFDILVRESHLSAPGERWLYERKKKSRKTINFEPSSILSLINDTSQSPPPPTPPITP